MKTEEMLKRLNNERTMASELIAAVGYFLDKAEGANCPKLKAKCDELITTGLAMISHHTAQITEMRNGEGLSATAQVSAKAKVVRGRRA